MEKGLSDYLQEAVEKIGIPKVLSCKSFVHRCVHLYKYACDVLFVWHVLILDFEEAITALMDKQGLNLFDLIDPEVIPYNVSV